MDLTFIKSTDLEGYFRLKSEVLGQWNVSEHISFQRGTLKSDNI